MKRFTLILALLTCIAFVPTSCKKDTLDPNIPNELYGTWYGDSGMYFYSVSFFKDKTCIIQGVSNQTYMTDFQDTWTIDCPFTYDNGHISCTGTLVKQIGATGEIVEIENYSTSFDFNGTYLTGGMEPAIYRYTKE